MLDLALFPSGPGKGGSGSTLCLGCGGTREGGDGEGKGGNERRCGAARWQRMTLDRCTLEEAAVAELLRGQPVSSGS